MSDAVVGTPRRRQGRRRPSEQLWAATRAATPSRATTTPPSAAGTHPAGEVGSGPREKIRRRSEAVGAASAPVDHRAKAAEQGIRAGVLRQEGVSAGGGGPGARGRGLPLS